MTLEQLKDYFQNGNRFEKATGLSHVSWASWFNKLGHVPIRSQQRIEIATNGQLIADLKDTPLYVNHRQEV